MSLDNKNHSLMEAGYTAPIAVSRVFDAIRLNAIVNDPSVRPHVGFLGDQNLDLTDLVRDTANYLIMGQYGCVLFIRLQNGLFEAHTQVLKEGRGQWVIGLAKAAMQWMFTRTDALELVSKCPTLRTRALAKCINGQFDCTVLGHDGNEVNVYSITLQNWLAHADHVANAGKEIADLLFLPDYCHKPLGVLRAMFSGSQIMKGIIFYNRWAAIAGSNMATITSLKPASFTIADTIIVVRENGEVYSATGTKH
jgi:hypothetical protein